MAGKKKPSDVPPPQDDTVYRVKHISRTAWEEGTLSLPGLTPRAARYEEPEFDDVAMDMAMTGEIPLELIRSMLRQQEQQHAEKKKRGSELAPGSMILPEEIGPARAEAAAEAPTPDEIEAAKEELRAMRAKSRLPRTEEAEPRAEVPRARAQEPKKPKARKKAEPKEEQKAQKQETKAGPSEEPAEKPVRLAKPAKPAKLAKPVRPAKPAKPVKPIKLAKPAKPAAPIEQPPAEEEESGGPLSIVNTIALLPHMREGQPSFWDDTVPLYRFPARDMLRALYRSLYYYGLRSVRPVRIAAHYALPYITKPLLTLWFLLRALVITLVHITFGRMRRAFKKGQAIHAKRLAVRKGRVRLRTMVRGVLIDYRHVLLPAANAAMPLAALLVLLIVIQGIASSTYALEVTFNNTKLGYISDESVFLQARDVANDNIAPIPETEQGEAAGNAAAGDDAEAARISQAQFNVARVHPEDIMPEYELAKLLLFNAEEDKAYAYGLRIDGVLIATIKNKTDADNVLTSIKNDKSKDLQKSDNAVVDFVQKVELIDGFYPAAQLVDGPTLNKILTQPQGGQAVNLEVKVVQIESRIEEVAFETVDSNNDNLYKGEVRIRVKGVPGQNRITERVTYIDGQRQDDVEFINSQPVKTPVTERRDIGTKSTTVPLPDGSTTVVRPSVGGFTWPVPDCTRISSPYGYRGKSFHKGIDIADGNTKGKIIVAAKSGVVELVQLGGSSYGNMIIINHGGGLKTRYAHILSGSISVRQGQSVSIGQPIARVGSTGNSTGPHLHFEVIVNGSTQNPRNYVKP